jgi:hypothetical protein
LIADVAGRAIRRRDLWRQRLNDGPHILLLLSRYGLAALDCLPNNCGLSGLRCHGSVLSHLRELHAALGISRRIRLCSIARASVGIRCICSLNLSLHAGIALLLR